MEKSKHLIEILENEGFKNSTIFSPDIFDPDVLEQVRKVIRENLTKTKTIRENSYTRSYSLKHNIEKYLQSDGESCHIYNGLLIYAMYLEGFRIRRAYNDSKNAYFNVSTISVRKLMVKSGIDDLRTKQFQK